MWYKRSMKIKSVCIAAGIAMLAFTGTNARADETGDLLNQLAALTKNGSADDQATTKLIKTLIECYSAYIQQLNALSNGTETPAANPAPQNAAAAQPSSAPAPTTSSNAAQTAPAPQAAPLLQTAQLQPGGSLKEVHLAGYPALPAAAPVSSVSNPTAAQLESGAETAREQAKLKRLLFEQWDNKSE
jgi:hypothetical protein